MRLKLTVLAAAVCVIFTLAWAIGLNAKNVASGWTQLHVVRLPPGPQGLKPIAVDSTGDVLAQDTGDGVVARYSPKAGEWLPGEIRFGSPTVTASPHGGIWLMDGLGPNPRVAWASSRSGTHPVAMGGPRRAWGPEIAVDGQGTAWVVGGRLYCVPSAPWFPCAEERPVLGRIARGAAHIKIIPVPAAKDLYSVAAGPNGHIWMVDVPRYSRHRCYRARIIDYAPRTGTFVSHVLPRPGHAGMLAYCESAFFGMSPTIQVAPDGTVWIEQILPPYTKQFAVTFVGLRGSRFRHFTAPESYGVPLIDRRGYVWLQRSRQGEPVVIDTITGSRATLSEPHGTLLQDPQGGMWWVEGQ